MNLYKLACVGLLVLTPFAAGAADDTPKRSPLSTLPPKGSVKLSQVIASAEARPGFYAIKSLKYKDNQYEVLYYMEDGAEVRLNYDSKTGQASPPASGGGLFGGD